MLNSSGTAYAGGEPFQRRFAMWWWAQGVGRDQWFPQATSPQP